MKHRPRRNAGTLLLRSAVATSASLIPLLGLPSPSCADPTVLSPGTTYDLGVGTFSSSAFSFEGGALRLRGTRYDTPSEFLISSDLLTGTGTIQLAASGDRGSVVAPDPSLTHATIGPGITLTSSSSHGGTIGSRTQSLSLLGPVTCPTGSLTITGQDWTASSLSVSDSGNLTLDGSFSSSVLPAVHHDGGTLTLQGAISNAGSSLDLAPLGNFTLAGSINGGTLTSSAGPINLLVGPAGTLNATTVDCDLVSFNVLHFSGGLAIANNHTISSSYFPGLSGTGPITGSGTVILNSIYSSGGGVIADAIGPNITLQTGPNPNGNSVRTGVNSPSLQGTISAQTSRVTVSLVADNWVNTGTLAVSAGTLALGGSFSPSSVGHLVRSGNGVVQVTGTLNMPPGDDTLSLDASTGSWDFNGATVNGGTLRTRDGATAAIVTSTTTFNGVTLDGAINVRGSGTLRGDLRGSGRITFDGGYNPVVAPSASSYTYAPTITFSADTGTGSIGAPGQSVTTQGDILAQAPYATILLAASNFTNAGHITASNGGVIGLNPPTFVNHGTIDLSNGGSVELIGDFTTASYRALNLPPSPAYLAGSLDNTADTLASTPASPLTILPNAFVTGGTLTGSPDAPLVVSNATLNSVTLAGSISYTYAPFGDSKITFANGSALTLRSPALDQANLDLRYGDTLAGSLDVSFSGDSSYGTVFAPPDNTLPAGLTIHTGTQGGTVGAPYAPLTVNGTISAQTSGKSITISSNSLVNNGTLQATNASTLLLSGSVTNTGTITTGTAATVKLTGSLTNTGRVDLAGGSLILNYLTSSPIDAARAQLLTGRNGGTWDAPTGFTSSPAATDPTHTLAVAYAEASQLLHLTASQTATWSGQPVDATSLLLTLTKYGDANLDGVVNADDYALLDRSYARSMTNAHWSDGDFNYDGTITPDDYLLIDTTYAQSHPLSPAFLSQRESQFGPAYLSSLLAAVPEPSSTLVCLLAGSLLPLPRRRRT